MNRKNDDKNDPSNDSEMVLNVKEVSSLLKIPASTIYDLAKKGKIRGVKFGKHWRFVKKDVDQYLFGRTAEVLINPDKRDKREFPRLNTNISADIISELKSKAQESFSAIISNLSEVGACVTHGGEIQGFSVGDPLMIRFKIQEQAKKLYEISARVVYATQNKIGIKFRLLKDIDREVLRCYVG